MEQFLNTVISAHNFGGLVDAAKMLTMWAVGAALIYLAIKHEMEPALLLPMGFGAILVNRPFSGAITQIIDGAKERLIRMPYSRMGLGLFAFVFHTIGGIMLAIFINLFAKNKVNPMIGACGISAFPMSSRVVHKMGVAEDDQNHLMMHAVS